MHIINYHSNFWLFQAVPFYPVFNLLSALLPVLSWSTNNLKPGFWSGNWNWYWWQTQPLSFTLITTWSGLGLVIKLALPAGANNPNKQEHSCNSNTWEPACKPNFWVTYESIFTGILTFWNNSDIDRFHHTQYFLINIQIADICFPKNPKSQTNTIDIDIDHSI